MKATTNALFTLLVDNEFGVLTRITALIRRAGWNIRSLAVAETKVPEVSRLTICLECRHHTLEQVLDRLGRLACVREIAPFSAETQVARELALLSLIQPDHSAVEALCRELGASLLEREGDRCILSLVCGQGELDKLLPRLNDAGLLEIARTGAVSLRRSPSQSHKEESSI